MRSIFAIAFLYSVQAYACPQLTGNYACKSSNSQTEILTVTQDASSGVTVYTVNGSPIPADNKAFAIADDDSLKDATLRAWCDDDVTLKGELLGKAWNSGSYYGDLNLSLGYSLSGSDLHVVSAGKITSATNGDLPVNGEMVCTKN